MDKISLLLIILALLTEVLSQGGFNVFKNQGKYKNVDAEVEQIDGKHKSEYEKLSVYSDCGGAGKLKSIYVEECEEDADPCELTADDKDQPFEVVFVPSENIHKLGHKMEGKLGKDGTYIVMYDHTIPKSKVKKGKTTVVSTNSPSLQRYWAGRTVYLKYIIYNADDENDQTIEACFSARFKMK